MTSSRLPNNLRYSEQVLDCIYFDARLIELTDSDEFVLDYQGREPRVPAYPGINKRAQEAKAEGHTYYGTECGSVGVIQFVPPTIASRRDEIPAFHRFEPYADQTLRRVYELDMRASAVSKGYIAWRNEACPDGFMTPIGLIPGEDGDFIPEDTERLELDAPQEFLMLCAEVQRNPVDVLRGFIADLCELQNYKNCPRADDYSSNGSDERVIARDYFERAYSMWSEDA